MLVFLKFLQDILQYVRLSLAWIRPRSCLHRPLQNIAGYLSFSWFVGLHLLVWTFVLIWRLLGLHYFVHLIYSCLRCTGAAADSPKSMRMVKSDVNGLVPAVFRGKNIKIESCIPSLIASNPFEVNNSCAQMLILLSMLAYEPLQVVQETCAAWNLKVMHITRAGINSPSSSLNHDYQVFLFYRLTGVPFVVACFRGPSPCDLTSWLSSASFPMVDAQKELWGYIHQGLHEELFNVKFPLLSHSTLVNGHGNGHAGNHGDHPNQSLMSVLQRALSDLDRACGMKMQLWVTGHSLGGGLATLFFGSVLKTAFLSSDGEFARFHIRGGYTFGAPRVGDRTFATEFQRHLQQCARVVFFRVVNGCDVVARLPASPVHGEGFAHAVPAVFLHWTHGGGVHMANNFGYRDCLRESILKTVEGIRALAKPRAAPSLPTAALHWFTTYFGFSPFTDHLPYMYLRQLDPHCRS